MEGKLMQSDVDIVNSIIENRGNCSGVDCFKCQVYNNNIWDGCGSDDESLTLAEKLSNQENGEGDLEIKVLEYLVQKEGVCYGLPCQLCPLFYRCECDSRSEILSSASSALAEIKKNTGNKYRTVRWVSEKSGKVLTGLLVAEVSGRAIVVSKKDASRVVSIDLEKLI